VTDLFGVAGRELLDRLEIPQPWRATVDASLELIDDIDAQIQAINKQLRTLAPEHRYMPLLMTSQASAGCCPTPSPQFVPVQSLTLIGISQSIRNVILTGRGIRPDTAA
jgi:hypothetical protein